MRESESPGSLKAQDVRKPRTSQLYRKSVPLRRDLGWEEAEPQRSFTCHTEIS